MDAGVLTEPENEPTSLYSAFFCNAYVEFGVDATTLFMPAHMFRNNCVSI